MIKLFKKRHNKVYTVNELVEMGVLKEVIDTS